VPFYTVPVTLLSLFFTPVLSWSDSMQNAYGEAWSSGAVEWTRTAFRQTVERMLVVAGLGVALFLAFGNSFIQLWTHGRLWLVPWMALSVSAMVVANALVKAAEYLLIGLNRQRHAAVAELANGILAMILVPFALRWLGLGAVGVGAIFALMVTSGWVLHREIGKRLGGDPFPDAVFVFKIAIAVAATTAIGKFLAGLGSPEDMGITAWRLVLGTLCCLAVFVFAALGLRLVALTEAISAGRWLRKRFAA
jgi:hypothetical protein